MAYWAFIWNTFLCKQKAMRKCCILGFFLPQISDILRVHCTSQPYHNLQAAVHPAATENVLSSSAIDDLCSMMKTISTREQADELADTMIETMSQMRIRQAEEKNYSLPILWSDMCGFQKTFKYCPYFQYVNSGSFSEKGFHYKTLSSLVAGESMLVWGSYVPIRMALGSTQPHKVGGGLCDEVVKSLLCVHGLESLPHSLIQMIWFASCGLHKLGHIMWFTSAFIWRSLGIIRLSYRVHAMSGAFDRACCCAERERENTYGEIRSTLKLIL